jgi:hypothetical protein
MFHLISHSVPTRSQRMGRSGVVPVIKSAVSASTRASGRRVTIIRAVSKVKFKA